MAPWKDLYEHERSDRWWFIGFGFICGTVFGILLDIANYYWWHLP